MKKLIFLFLFVSSLLHGQQVEQYSFGLLYDGLRNPAAIGRAESLRAIGIVRQQWVGLSGSPSSQYGVIDVPLGMLSGGVGLSFQQSTLGAHKVQRAKLGYSFHKPFGDHSYVAIGTMIGMMMVEYDGNKLRTPSGIYGNGQIEHHDDLLSLVPFSGNTYGVDVGLYGRIQNLDIGLSVVNALAGKMQIDQLTYEPQRHFFGQLGYEFDWSGAIQLKTGVQVYANSTILQSQALIMGTWNEVYSLGATIRGYGKTSQESIGGIAGIKLNEHFQLFYSYEYNILPLRNVFDANHELAIVYSLNKPIGKGRLPKVIYNPRYF